MYKFAFGLVTLAMLIGAISGIRLSFTMLTMPKASSVGIGLMLIPLLFNALIAWLLTARIVRAWRSGQPLLSPDFVKQKRLGYSFGMLLIWVGVIGAAIFIGFTLVLLSGAFGSVGGFSGVPLGLAIVCSFWGVVFVEASRARWQKAAAAT